MIFYMENLKNFLEYINWFMKSKYKVNIKISILFLPISHNQLELKN